MSLLLRHLETHGLLAPTDLEAAVRRQKHAGGSLDTAILELGLMKPSELAAALQAACGLDGPPLRLLERAPTRPWDLVPKDLVDIGWAIPLAIVGGKVMVAVHPDLPDARLGQLFRQVRGLYPVVAPECCLAKVAAERTGAILAPRYAMLVLDYLEGLRGESETSSPGLAGRAPIGEPSGAQPASSAAAREGEAVPEDRSDAVPVPTTRQVAQPVAAAPAGGSAVDTAPPASAAPARAAEAEAAPVSSDREQVAHATVSSDREQVAHAPVSSDREQVAHAPVSSDREKVAHAPVSSDREQVAHAPVSSDREQVAHATVSSDREPVGRAPVSSAREPTSHPPVSSAREPTSHPPVSSAREPVSHPPVSSAREPTSHPPVSSAREPASQAPAASEGQGTAGPQPEAPRGRPRGPATPADAPAPRPALSPAQRFEAARTALAQARERDRITEALVRAAALIAPRVALFGVKREGLRVLAAPGSALRLTEGLVIPLPEGGLLDRAVSGQGPFHLLTEPSLAFAVGQPLGIPCVFEPVLAGGRTVLMLYLDRAGVAFEPSERAILRDLCDVARQSLEALLRLLGWVVPVAQSGAPDPGPVRPHLAAPAIAVADTGADEPSETPAETPERPAAVDEHAEASPHDSASSRSRGSIRTGRPRPVITLVNPIRREDPASAPQREASGPAVAATGDALAPAPPTGEASGETTDTTAEASTAPTDVPTTPGAADGERRPPQTRVGLGLPPVPVPLGPDLDPDSPLVARIAALAENPAVAGDMSPETARDDAVGPSTASLEAVLSDSREGDLPARENALPPGPGTLLDLAAPPTDAPGRAGEPAAASSAPAAEEAPATDGLAPAPVTAAPATAPASDGLAPAPVTAAPATAPPTDGLAPATAAPATAPPTAPPTTPPTAAPATVPPSATPTLPPDEPPPVAAPAALADAVPPKTLIPNLIAPPGTPGAGRRRRKPEPAPDPEPVLVIPKTLLGRTNALSPHPMARRADPAPAAASAPPTLSMPATLIGPRSGRRRSKTETRPPASEPALHMPRLVRDPPAGPPPSAIATLPPADEPPPVAVEKVPEDMSETTLPSAPEPQDMSEETSIQAPAVDVAPAPAGERGADPDEEIDALIAAYLHAPEETGVEKLRAHGERALVRLAARFPGPIDLANATNFPPPSQHGPLLRACVEIGPAMSPHVLQAFTSPRPQIRFYAAFLFQELRDPRSLHPLGDLAFDPDPDVRLIATRVLESYNRAPEFKAVAARIRGELDSRDRDRQLLAVEATGTLRDTLAIPRLIDLLAVRDKHLREAALEALCSITAKHHGYRAARWRAWYAEHGGEPRIEWVIDGLRHRDVAVRRWAADELARITGQRIPFPADGDRRAREQAIRAWLTWWEEHRAEYTAT